MHKVIIYFLFPFLISCSTPEPDNENVSEAARTLEFVGEVSFHQSKNSDSSVAVIEVAIADTESTRNEGLMNVTGLSQNAGMLFIFDDEQPRSFWMANTPLSLDILFVDSDFKIVRIHQNTAPYSNRSIESELPAKYVVEVNSGFALRNDIMEKMYIDISMPENE